MNNKTINSFPRKQQGVVLVLALIMLLLVTIIGVSAVRMSNFDTQVAGNSMFKQLVFQGAESALGRSVSNSNLYNIVQASNRAVGEVQIEASNFPAETVVGGGQLNSSGKVVYQTNIDIPPYSNVAYSSDTSYQIFQFIGQSNLATTAATDRHTEGRAVPIPKQ